MNLARDTDRRATKGPVNFQGANGPSPNTPGGSFMAQWFFEPGHTAAEFCVRHMMVTYVRGHFKNIKGKLVYDPKNPQGAQAEVRIDAKSIWTGEPDRDTHLRSADFLDVDHHPEITFKSTRVTIIGDHDYVVRGQLTIRGVTREASLKVRSLGEWQTPWWENGIDKGPKTRAGFFAETTINRHEFGVSWNSVLDKGGVVVGDLVEITIDAEAIFEGN
ncbi:MAG: YceI family protein [Terriglobia bacterium]